MSVLPPVVATLLADTKGFTSSMDRAQAKMGEFGASADSTSSKFSSFANKASTAILGAGVVVGAVSIKMAGDFQSAMTSLVTGAGESEKNIKMVSNGILAMAPIVGQMPTQLAQGMYMIESAGFHGAAGLSVLKAAAEGAAAGSAQMATVGNALTSVLHDYSIPASHATQVTSALIATVASGKTHLEDLAGSLGRVLPTASAVGLSFQQVAAAMAVQTNTGMSARLAAMHLNATMLALVAPNKTAAKSLESVGISAQDLKNELANPNQGLGYALTNIENHLATKYPRGSAAFTGALKQDVGGVVGLSTALALTGTHAQEFANTVNTIGQTLSGPGGMVKGFSKVKTDFNFQLQQLKATAAAFAIKLGDWLLPKAATAIAWANNLINYFQSHPLVAKLTSDTAISLFAAALGVKMFEMAGKMGALFGLEMSGTYASKAGLVIGAGIASYLATSSLLNWLKGMATVHPSARLGSGSAALAAAESKAGINSSATAVLGSGTTDYLVHHKGSHPMVVTNKTKARVTG